MIVAWYGIKGQKEGYVKISFANLTSKKRYEDQTGMVCLKSFQRGKKGGRK